MLGGLRELFGGLSERGRFWLAVVMVVAVVGVLVAMMVMGVDVVAVFGPLWAMLGG